MNRIWIGLVLLAIAAVILGTSPGRIAKKLSAIDQGFMRLTKPKWVEPTVVEVSAGGTVDLAAASVVLVARWPWDPIEELRFVSDDGAVQVPVELLSPSEDPPDGALHVPTGSLIPAEDQTDGGRALYAMILVEALSLQELQEGLGFSYLPAGSWRIEGLDGFMPVDVQILGLDIEAFAAAVAEAGFAMATAIGVQLTIAATEALITVGIVIVAIVGFVLLAFGIAAEHRRAAAAAS